MKLDNFRAPWQFLLTPFMGRTYWFDCARCGYRAKVAGGADRGLNLFVRTIACRDCREVYDAVTRWKVLPGSVDGVARRQHGLSWPNGGGLRHLSAAPPRFQHALNRLLYARARESQWVQFELRCPVSAQHRIEPWDEPGKCPKCGLYLERNPLPFRIWE